MCIMIIMQGTGTLATQAHARAYVRQNDPQEIANNAKTHS